MMKGAFVDRMRSGPSLLGLSAAALLASVALAAGQGAGQANQIIEVRVTGNTFRSSAAVLADVTIRPGQVYDPNAVRLDEQRLLKTRRYASVTATPTRTARGVIVTFHVRERPVIESLAFRGNKSLSDKELRKAVHFAGGDPVDEFLIQSGADAIASLYRADGYYRVSVTYDRPALAQRRQVIYAIVEGPKGYLRDIRFLGNEQIGSFELRQHIKSKKRLWPFTSGALDLETIDRDVVDLRVFYHSRGFLDAQVARELTYEGRAATLTFMIEEGPRYRIQRNVFMGASVFSPAELQRGLSLVCPEYYDEAKLRRDRQEVQNRYGQIGYISATVSVRPHYTEKAGEVNLVYTIHEGRQMRVGSIAIRGNVITQQRVIRRQIRVRPGQLYNTAAVMESAERLRETQLFNSVDITPFGEAPNYRNVLVQVKEGKTGQFIVGAGVDSNAGLLGSIRLVERNFNLLAWPTSWRQVKRGEGFRGAGQLLRISAEPGTRFMRFRLDWDEPWLYDKPISLGGSLYHFMAQRETWDETHYGGEARLGHRFPNGWYVQGSTRMEGIDISNIDRTKAPFDVRQVAGTSSLEALRVQLIRDRTDSRWMPTHGDRLHLDYQQVVGDYFFGKFRGDYHRYWTVYEDEQDRKHILSMRGGLYQIFGSAPVFERLYAGGLGTMRGFKFRGISPRQGPWHQVVGGNFSMLAGLQYTFPLVGKQLRGIVFLDSGTVERNTTITTYRVSAGVGFQVYMLHAPIPLEFDFGIPVVKQGVDDLQLLAFSIGWAF